MPMFFLKHWKKLLYMAVAIAVAGTIFAGYMFVRGLVDDLSDAQRRLGTVETAYEVQNATIDAQRAALEEWKATQEELERQLKELNDVTIEARRESAELRQFFADSDLDTLEDDDLEALANGASRRADCLLSQATGASGLDCSGEHQPTVDNTSPETFPG